MSKIGRRPILIRDVKVKIDGQAISYTGKHASGVHVVPKELVAELDNNKLKLTVVENTRENRQLWGLHRALLANKIAGAHELFSKQVKIVGLGYKAQAKGDKLEFTLGHSHKKEVALPKAISADIDKTGQLLTLKSFDKELLGKLCGELKTLRPVEPYKGTGVLLSTDVVIKKAGKAKAA